MPPDTISASIPRTALVTGGARRLGREIALALADAGFAVAIHHFQSHADAESTAQAARAAGVRACTLQADLASERAMHETVAEAEQLLGGPIGVLVNNAATFERDEWDSVTRQSWDRHVEPNLRAPFVLMQQFAAALPVSAEGVVINMIDQRVWSLTPHFVSYTVSKAGLWTLTQSMALALAPRIRVNAIGPGPAMPSLRQTPAQFARQCAGLPLRHGTTPEEVGRAAIAILSLPCLTGQMLALDGGQHLQWGARALPPEE